VRIALVHDYLAQCGGAERVLLELAAMFPEAPIYTSLYAPELTFPDFAALDIRTSALQTRVAPQRFRSALLRYPAAFRSFDLSDFDTVLVSSSAFAHHVRHDHSYVYCHTPPRFLYHPESYGGGRVRAAVTRHALAPLRRADLRAAVHHVSYVANSEATARRVRLTYGREAGVIYPPLRTAHLPDPLSPLPSAPRALVVSRLLPYKRIDVAIEACALAGIPLSVVGEGPDRDRLERLGGNVELLGRVADDELARLFVAATVVLVPGREDFGYLPVESNFAGRPVVALATGGALETIVDGTSGRLVASHNVRLWAEVLREVHERSWSPAELRASTQRFWAASFRGSVAHWVRDD
jgi:glycosyltransferase involved in cell wall biosynthesis